MTDPMQAEIDRAQLIELSRRFTEIEREFETARDFMRQLIERVDALEQARNGNPERKGTP